MGINFFSSEEDQKEFHRSTIKDRENSIRFIEGIKYKKRYVGFSVIRGGALQ